MPRRRIADGLPMSTALRRKRAGRRTANTKAVQAFVRRMQIATLTDRRGHVLEDGQHGGV